ncbi:FAD-dependent oxidoreductase [Burkholderia sp. SFA1]|uniref:FAD-dependent oxidoreductase n=1 Tax=unclassified Caballeronia TaxID=2646786 RepID=UPI001F313C4E|nr:MULTISPECIES: FAD-dependent oxidoreductase [unclassified Caballeronia]MCE4544209.1 FAD-dependent oxidoreductase [Caballeronia sp. PC1]MCE4571360.1 FAD-dependent oxidoreductase [Caballeronia sp. CLC5]BBP98726.1 FAD-dependent oxidoreductase [Burkholderia sp. SFA1]
MSVNYASLRFEYERAPDHDAPASSPYPVAVVGAGPVGLATAIDLAQQGVRTVLLDNDDTVSTGSRAICFAKRTLEIFDRLGCGDRMIEKGVSWNVGKVFLHDDLVYTFNLLPETGHSRPAFINLQQYYVEGFLAERAMELEQLQLRWKSNVVGVTQHEDHVELQVETPDGVYALKAQYVVAADGARSPMRRALNLDSQGRTFKDRFLIADVKMKAPFPTERWFWFDPPFHRNQSVLLHRQPDDVWRIDFQLGWDADPVAEKAPERVIPRVKALLGEDAEFELEWVSVYTFSCVRMESFRHGRVIFAGDAAHGVSPFGARGANSGVQDADNLAWKLRLVVNGDAPHALLDTYASEREYAADENILNSTRSTDFITPKSAVSRLFRDATLKLAKDAAFARRIANSGRLSVPAVLRDSTLSTPDSKDDVFDGAMMPGAPCVDAPVRVDDRDAWLLPQTHGGAFTGLYFCGLGHGPDACAQSLAALSSAALPVRTLIVVPRGMACAVPGVTVVEDVEGMVAHRFDARPGTFYLLRPDQHVCARWRAFDAASVMAAVKRATCNG